MLRKKLKVFGNLALFFFNVFLFVFFVDFELFFTNRITCIRSHFNIWYHFLIYITYSIRWYQLFSYKLFEWVISPIRICDITFSISIGYTTSFNWWFYRNKLYLKNTPIIDELSSINIYHLNTRTVYL